MAKAKKSVKAKRAAKRTPKAKRATAAQVEKGQRDQRFATIVNGMRQEMSDNQSHRPSENNATTVLDELQKLYDEK